MRDVRRRPGDRPSRPDLLAEVEREYINLADIHNEWPGRNKPEGQMKLGRLRDLICKATGREPQDVQDDYGNRAAIRSSTQAVAVRAFFKARKESQNANA